MLACHFVCELITVGRVLKTEFIYCAILLSIPSMTSKVKTEGIDLKIIAFGWIRFPRAKTQLLIPKLVLLLWVICLKYCHNS